MSGTLDLFCNMVLKPKRSISGDIHKEYTGISMVFIQLISTSSGLLHCDMVVLKSNLA